MGLCNADSVDKQKQLVPVHAVIVQTVLEEVVTVFVDLLKALAGQLVDLLPEAGPHLRCLRSAEMQVDLLGVESFL
jgi:hypothetical protein